MSTVESGKSYLEHPLAVQLGLNHTLPPLAHAYGGVPERFYDVLLESVESLFGGELPEPTFNASMRTMFGFEAVKLLDIDRIIGTIVKQVQVVLADKQSRHLVGLLHQQRTDSNCLLSEWQAYRRAAEEEAGQSLVFVQTVRLLNTSVSIIESTLLQGSHTIKAHLLFAGDRLPQDTERTVERWQVYLDSYGRKRRTLGIDKSKLKLPFLYRYALRACL